MKVVFIVRATLFTVPGGDTVQVKETAAQLKLLGVEVDIKLTKEKIDYPAYDLLHFFNIIRPADILVHIKRAKKPFVISPILVDYSLYDKQYRSGFSGKLFRWLPPAGIEYVKTVYRAVRRRDHLASIAYLWKGQQRSIKEILTQTKCVLVSTDEEYKQLIKWYDIEPPFTIVPNGIDTCLFKPPATTQRQQDLVLCVARIEGIKNQHNLITALNNTKFRLLLIGNAAPNQKKYYQSCKKIAAANVSFIDHLPQEQLIQYYAAAKVHVLPSWFEVCGLSSLEAAAMGSQVVITDNGYARSYFKESAFYCDPADAGSILKAVEKAAVSSVDKALQNNIIEQYSWRSVAEKILAAYKRYAVQ
jgi:glycosyltransferase involved in cell wall biosynthesis